MFVLVCVADFQPELFVLSGGLMACFLVPLADGIVVSALDKIVFCSKKSADGVISESKKNIAVLKNMLYGGSFLLAIEHIYHGEVSLIPPFLTAVKTPEEIPIMLKEMATVGVGMAALVTAVWGIGCAVKHFVKKTKSRGALCA